MLPLEDRCADCPDASAWARVMVPGGATVDTVTAGDPHLVLRCTFEVEVRGAEPMREILVVDAPRGRAARIVPASEWDLDGAWTPVEVAGVPGPDYDQLVARARALVDASVEPWIALAIEGAADRLAPSLRNLRRRAAAQRAEAPSEAKAITLHLQREEAVLTERNTIYVAIRLVNAIALRYAGSEVRVHRSGDVVSVGPHSVCSDCSTPSSEMLLDDALHLVCPSCAIRCAGCGAGTCSSCGVRYRDCSVCALSTCSDCLTRCATCGQAVCSVDTESCALGAETVCYRCLSDCAHDEDVLCSAHAVTCAAGEVMSTAHQVETQDAVPACAAHAHTCDACGGMFSIRGVVKTQDGRWACRADQRSCSLCGDERWYLPGDMAVCSIDKDTVCAAKHAAPCSMGDIACTAHTAACVSGDTVCQAHVLRCITGGEITCRTHAARCTACSGTLCVKHGYSCPASMHVVCEKEFSWRCDLCDRPTCRLCTGPRCPACRMLRAPSVPVDAATLAFLGLSHAPTLMGSAGVRVVAVERSLLRTTVVVAEGGNVQNRRQLGPLQRRGLGV